jgi:hypothetical protein
VHPAKPSARFRIADRRDDDGRIAERRRPDDKSSGGIPEHAGEPGAASRNCGHEVVWGEEIDGGDWGFRGLDSHTLNR